MKKKSFYEQWGDEIKKESNKSAEEIDFSNILWNILMLIRWLILDTIFS